MDSNTVATINNITRMQRCTNYFFIIIWYVSLFRRAIWYLYSQELSCVTSGKTANKANACSVPNNIPNHNSICGFVKKHELNTKWRTKWNLILYIFLHTTREFYFVRAGCHALWNFRFVYVCAWPLVCKFHIPFQIIYQLKNHISPNVLVCNLVQLYVMCTYTYAYVI